MININLLLSTDDNHLFKNVISKFYHAQPLRFMLLLYRHQGSQ